MAELKEINTEKELNDTDIIEEDFDDEVEYFIDVKTNKTSIPMFGLTYFKEDVTYTDEYDHVFKVFIKIKNKKETVLESTLIIYTEAAINNNTLQYYADCAGEEELHYFESLNSTKEFKRELGDYDYGDIYYEWGRNIVSCAIYRLYIYPEYRRKGLGANLLNYLPNILEKTLNLKLRCAVTYPKPDKGQEKSMKKTMIKTIVDNGFRKIGRSNFYIRDYLEDLYEEY